MLQKWQIYQKASAGDTQWSASHKRVPWLWRRDWRSDGASFHKATCTHNSHWRYLPGRTQSSMHLVLLIHSKTPANFSTHIHSLFLFKILARSQVFAHNFSEVRQKISKILVISLNQFSKYIQDNKKTQGILVLCIWCYIFGWDGAFSCHHCFLSFSVHPQFGNFPSIWITFFSCLLTCQKRYFTTK